MSCCVEHDRKTEECHDNLTAKQLKKAYPAEHEHQTKELEKNKQLPLSVVVDIFRKPLKEFEVLQGTPLGRHFTEPTWFGDFWEIFEMKHDLTKSGNEESKANEDMDVDNDDDIVEKPEDEKQAAVSKWNDVAEAETLTNQAPTDATLPVDAAEIVARPAKQRRVTRGSSMTRVSVASAPVMRFGGGGSETDSSEEFEFM